MLFCKDPSKTCNTDRCKSKVGKEMDFCPACLAQRELDKLERKVLKAALVVRIADAAAAREAEAAAAAREEVAAKALKSWLAASATEAMAIEAQALKDAEAYRLARQSHDAKKKDRVNTQQDRKMYLNSLIAASGQTLVTSFFKKSDNEVPRGIAHFLRSSSTRRW